MKKTTLLILLILLLTACSDKAVDEATTVLPSLTETPKPTSTPTASPTPVSVTPPTISPTVTPIATLVNKADYVMTLFQGDRDCPLPCWWGIIPGQTSWIDARQFLLPFATGIYQMELYRNNGAAGYYFVYPESEIVFNLRFEIEEGLVQKIIFDPSNLFPLDNLRIHKILSTYGAPSDIRIVVGPTGPSGTMVKMYFIYNNLGFYVTYFTNQAVINGQGDIDACFENSPSVDSVNINLKGEINFMDEIEEFNFYPVYDLEQVSNFSVKEFFEIYQKNGNSDFCIQLVGYPWP